MKQVWFDIFISIGLFIIMLFYLKNIVVFAFLGGACLFHTLNIFDKMQIQKKLLRSIEEIHGIKLR